MKARNSVSLLVSIMNKFLLPFLIIRDYFNPYSNLQLKLALKRRREQSDITRLTLEQVKGKLVEYEREKCKSPFYTGVGSRGQSKVALARIFIGQTERCLCLDDLDGALENSLLAKRKVEEALAYVHDGLSEHDMVGY